MNRIKEYFYRLLIWLFPHDPDFYVFYGLFLEKQGRDEEAGDFLYDVEEKKRVKPNFSFLNNLACYALRIYKSQEKKNEKALEVAEENFELAAKIGLSNREKNLLLRNIVDLLKTSGAYDKVHDILCELQSKTPNDPEINFQLAMVLMIRNRYEESGDCFIEAINNAEGIDKIKGQLGYVWLKQILGKQTEALEYLNFLFSSILKSNNNNVKLCANLLKEAEKGLLNGVPSSFGQKWLKFDYQKELESFLKQKAPINPEDGKGKKEDPLSAKESIGKEFDLEQ